MTVKTSEPDKFAAFASNVQIAHGLDVTIPDVLVVTLPSDFPAGKSVLFAGMTAPAALRLAAPVATTEFTFTP